MQRRCAGDIDDMDVGVLLEQQPDDAFVVPRGKRLAVDALHREMERGVALVVLCVDVRAGVDERPHDVE